MFPFRKRPPTKVEQLKQAVADGVHSLLDHVPTDKIEDLTRNAAKAAQHSGELAAQKISEAAAHVRGAAVHAGESAAEAASHARESAVHAKDAAIGSASQAAQSVRDRFSRHADDAAQNAEETLEEVQETARQKVRRAEDRVAQAADDADFGSVSVQVADNSSKWLWLGVGLLAGGMVALLFAPSSGRRSRAAIKDRLGKVRHGATDAATAASDKAADIKNRAEGLAHKMEQKLSTDVEAEDDRTLVDRVRSALGHVEVLRHLERLNIDCAEGIITLRGPMMDAELQTIIEKAVRAVPGVKDVVSDFLPDEEPAEPANYAS